MIIILSSSYIEKEGFVYTNPSCLISDLKYNKSIILVNELLKNKIDQSNCLRFIRTFFPKYRVIINV